MRFVLGNDKKADVKTIEAIPAVKGLSPMQVNSKLSLVMMYQSFITISLLNQGLKVFLKAAKSAAKSNQNPVQRVMTTLAEIFTPLIPALIVGGASSWSAKCLG